MSMHPGWVQTEMGGAGAQVDRRGGVSRYIVSSTHNLGLRKLVTIYGTCRSDDNILDDPEVTANLYCNFAYLYWEGCVIRSIYLR